MEPEIKPKRAYKKSTIITVGSEKPKAEKTRHYTNNKMFFESLCAYQDECAKFDAGDITKKPKIPEYIGECILLIATNLAKNRNFYRILYKEDMILTAVEACIRKLRNFSRENTHNPFSYFTQICYFEFIDVIKQENFQLYLKYKSLVDSFDDKDLENIQSEMDEGQVEDRAYNTPNDTFTTANSYVSDFESRIKDKKKVSTKQKVGGLFD